MKRLYEFFFSRWKREIVDRGDESWETRWRNMTTGDVVSTHAYTRSFVDYKYTNKFDGSTKIKRKYLN